MHKDTNAMRKRQEGYRVRNWPANNASLINRGNMTMRIDEAELAD
ncbi:hypothetical protein [Burkholderia ubonensis]|nr:hypothetical protein [Burkholderia ubonensis]